MKNTSLPLGSWTIAYIGTVALINWLFVVVEPINIMGEPLPPVMLIVGFVFVFRDFAQREIGHWVFAAMLLVMRIAEVLTLLGFLHTPRYFATHHLDMDPQEVDQFIAGDLHGIGPMVVNGLRKKMKAVHDVLAQEVADAKDVDELWKAQARHNLMQTAFAHLT